MATTLNISQLIGSDDEFYRTLKDSISSSIRTAMPGIIQSFDPKEQTVTVQPALREQITLPDQSKEWATLPLLLDVPIVLPRAGNMVLTMPIRQGDECLVIFGDMCMDAWWSNGGVQNQIEKRRHDLSDGYAILGIWSQPNTIPEYSTDSAELRSLDGNTKISLKQDEISMNSESVKVNEKDITSIADGNYFPGAILW